MLWTRRTSFDRRLFVFGSLILGYWILTGLALSTARPPTASRYLYPGAIMLMLALAVLIGRRRLTAPLLAGLAVVVALSLVANVRQLTYGGAFFRTQGDIDRAVLTATDALGVQAPATLILEEAPAFEGLPAYNHPGLHFTVDSYRAAKARNDTPALDPAELPRFGEAARQAVDLVIVRALGIAPVPIEGRGPEAVESASLEFGKGLTGARTESAGCSRIDPGTQGVVATFSAPAGGFEMMLGRGGTGTVYLRRFADNFSVPLIPVEPGYRWASRSSPMRSGGRVGRSKSAPRRRLRSAPGRESRGARPRHARADAAPTRTSALPSGARPASTRARS